MKRKIKMFFVIVIIFCVVFILSHEINLPDIENMSEDFAKIGINTYASLPVFELDSDWEAIPFIDNKAFQYLIDSYRTEYGDTTFKSGDKELYPLYIEKFTELLNLKTMFYDEEKKQYFHISEYEEFDFSKAGVWTIHIEYSTTYDPHNFLYYFFDINNDNAPELVMSNYRAVLIIRYDNKSDKLFLWEYFSEKSPRITGTQKVYWPGLNVPMRSLYYKMDEDGEEELHVSTYASGFSLNNGDSGLLCLVSLPKHKDKPKDAVIPEDIYKQAVVFPDFSEDPAFKVTEDQFKTIESILLPTSKEQRQEEELTYDELIAIPGVLRNTRPPIPIDK